MPLARSSGSQVNIQANNATKHSITFRKRTLLGRLQLVRSVNPFEVKQVNISDENEEKCENPKVETEVYVASTVTSKESNGDDCVSNNYIPDVSLEGLSAEQKCVVQKMLQAEAESFSKAE